MATLTPELIARECLSLLETHGPEALTFRRIGRHLGVDPTALYRHFKNKDELILAIGDLLMSTAMDGYDPADDWAESLRNLLHRSRAVYLAHPHAAVLATTRVTRREGEMAIVEAILQELHRAGFPPPEAARLYRALDDMNLAFAGLDAAFRILSEEQQAKDVGAWSQEYAQADPGRYPRIAATAEHLADIGEDPTYELALDLMLESIIRRAPHPSRRS
ncbi:TetR/AcrR family transcriptional regulator [Sediminivirga luteola]|uniref:TetR/AcrR family transcriptional regulator n=1 Tax=Sediminivirga luteola TaxID=1774748 RepID=UPI001F589172|nr:TetR/AcrR family transcriptional regulator [Sediminivirga luteola]MCI2265538.1 TetR/AcrR family transcriptional regulator [Sediminivirga luteola]